MRRWTSRGAFGAAARSLVVAALAAQAGGCGGAAPTGTGRATPTAAASAAPTLALVHGRLIDGTGAEPIADAVVLVSGDRIAAAGSASSVAVPGGVETIDLAGAAILPGFINAHVHRGFDRTNLRAWAQGGVTTVRDEGTSPALVRSLPGLRAEIGADPLYSRLVSAGAILAVPGGYGEWTVSSPEEARAAVADEAEAGADAIKVALEDGYAGRTGLPKLTPEELRAIVEAAHERDLPVSGHLTQGAYLQGLLDAGIDDVSHVPYDAVPASAIRTMVAHDVYLVPTFTVFRNYGAAVDGCVANVRSVVEQGGHVALGNDYGGGPGEFELGIPMYEVEMLARAGMTPMQVIEAGTKNAAHVLRLDDEIGSIRPGLAADILVVGGDPLADLHALEQVRLVVHAGRVIRDEIRG